MALETASFINGLNPANPPAGDPAAQAANHIRLLKGVLQATFPAITAAVTPTAQQLNANLVPVGAVLMWPGTAATIPAGWGFCDGSTYARLDGTGNITAPDYRDKFLASAGVTYIQGSSGGAASSTPVTLIGSYALQQGDLPSYNLTVTDPGHAHSITDPGHNHTITENPAAGGGGGGSLVSYKGYNSDSNTNTTWTNTTGITIQSHTTGLTVASGGSGNAHAHSAITSSVPTLPPYVAVVHMMKL